MYPSINPSIYLSIYQSIYINVLYISTPLSGQIRNFSQLVKEVWWSDLRNEAIIQRWTVSKCPHSVTCNKKRRVQGSVSIRKMCANQSSIKEKGQKLSMRSYVYRLVIISTNDLFPYYFTHITKSVRHTCTTASHCQVFWLIL